MRKLHKPSPAESPMLFEIDPEPAPETLPALGGIPLLVQAFGSLGLPARVKRHVQVKQRERGLHEASWVESFVILNAAGPEFLLTSTRRLLSRPFPGRGELLPAMKAATDGLGQFIWFRQKGPTLLSCFPGWFALAVRWGSCGIRNPDAAAREHSNQRMGYAITSCSPTWRRIGKSDCCTGARSRVADGIKVLALLGFECPATL